ncbi:MAG: redoxin domain-containing protein [Gammaproteobacteria bacterium]
MYDPFVKRLQSARRALAALCVLCLPVACHAAPEVGDLAPDFEMQGSDGKRHQLSDYRGRTVILAWFPKAFTGG